MILSNKNEIMKQAQNALKNAPGVGLTEADLAFFKRHGGNEEDGGAEPVIFKLLPSGTIRVKNTKGCLQIFIMNLKKCPAKVNCMDAKKYPLMAINAARVAAIKEMTSLGIDVNIGDWGSFGRAGDVVDVYAKVIKTRKALKSTGYTVKKAIDRAGWTLYNPEGMEMKTSTDAPAAIVEVGQNYCSAVNTWDAVKNIK